MIFPFNNPQKTNEHAYSEIKYAMNHLQDNTLLFLDSISKIKYQDESISNTIERVNDGEVKVMISNSGSNSISEWLRFKKYLPKSEKLYVSVAYQISEDETNKKHSVVPIDGKVSIFFPAEKETSNLKFHLHAPFASTVARDSIKDLKENGELRDLIATLTCESLEYIKNHDLLDFNFLKCLPIEDDNIPAFYKPILDGLVKVFNNLNYAPTEDGLFVPAVNCYRSSKNIRNIIDTEMLKVLNDIPKDSSIYWIKNPSQKNNREDKFLQSLNIKPINPEDLPELLEVFNTYASWRMKNYDEEDLKFILESKSNNWVKGLYDLLYDLYKKNDIDIDSLKFLIKIEDNTFNIDEENCYFKNEADDAIGNTNYVHSDVYEKDPNAKNQNSRLFLEVLGVKEIDLEEKVKMIIDEFYGYYREQDISDTKHLNHWRLFIRYFKEKGDASLFADQQVLYNSQRELVTPDKILLDRPFLETNLQLIDGKIGGYHILNQLYEKISYKDTFLSLITILKANVTIPIEERCIYRHRDYLKLYEKGNTSNKTIADDYKIHNLDQILVDKSPEISNLVWKTMIKADKKVLKARYQRIKTSNMNIAPSTLIYDLMDTPWIPDKKGKFYKPCDISREMLPDEFVYDNANGWLSAIKFGEAIIKNDEDYKAKYKISFRTFRKDLMKTLAKLKEYSQKKSCLNMIERLKSINKEQEDIKPNLKSAVLKVRSIY